MNKYMLILCMTLSFMMHAQNPSITSRQVKSPQQITLNDIGMPKKLETKIDAGKITIRTADSGFSCSYRGHKTDMSKTVKVKKGGDTLELEFKKDKSSDPDNATVDFNLVLPKNCEIKINIGAGAVDIASVNGEIKVEAGSVIIKAHAISNDAELSLGSGTIDVIYADNKLHIPKKCKIKAGSARVILTVPSSFCVKNKIKGAPFASKVTNAFEPCAQKPDITFEGNIGSGSVAIKKK